MLTSADIKKKAAQLGATVCGIGRIYEEPDPQRDPRSILPGATCIIGFDFAVPKGLYKAMEQGNQYYTYTTMGVKYIDEEMAEIFLLKIGGMIENEGYDACLQKAIPNLRIKGDKTTNPEVVDTYELIHAEPVASGKPAPDVIIDFGKAAKACGLGEKGLYGNLLIDEFGPLVRWCFILTDAELAPTEMKKPHLCDYCGKCMEAYPGNAISPAGEVDNWQCSVYYNGANGLKNPFMPPDALSDMEDRLAIIAGEAKVTPETARKIIDKLYFYPPAQHAYQCSICGRAGQIACYAHLEERGLLTKKFKTPFRKRQPWQFDLEDYR